MNRILPYGLGAEMMAYQPEIFMDIPRHDFNCNTLGRPASLMPNKAHQRHSKKVKARKRAARLGHK